MGLSCLRYKAYDWAKQRWLTQKLFYCGLPYRHYDTVSIAGTVIDCAHKSADGDVDFDLQAEAPAYLVALSKRWHLECTPCQPDALRAQIAGLKIGQRITVTGTRTFDNDHHIFAWKFGGGHWEVHPVTNIKEET